ncbi:MAG: peptidase S8, partial [Bacteroidetes bacterium]
HKVEINASDLQAGVYYYTLTADGYTVTKKMIVY